MHISTVLCIFFVAHCSISYLLMCCLHVLLPKDHVASAAVLWQLLQQMRKWPQMRTWQGLVSVDCPQPFLKALQWHGMGVRHPCK